MIFSRTGRRQNCLHTACRRGHGDIVENLFQTCSDKLLFEMTDNAGTCLHLACQQGHFKIANQFAMNPITAGGEALISKTAAGGLSCLHLACYHCHIEIVKGLINPTGQALCLNLTLEGCTLPVKGVILLCTVSRRQERPTASSA